MPIFVTVSHGRPLTDADTGEKTFVDAGRYELERIKNPLGFVDDWLVIKGTRKGFTEKNWWGIARASQAGREGETTIPDADRIIIEESEGSPVLS